MVKEVQRVAKPGESIKIVSGEYDCFRLGDICEVYAVNKKTGDVLIYDGSVSLKNKVSLNDYVVLEQVTEKKENEEEISGMEKGLDMLLKGALLHGVMEDFIEKQRKDYFLKKVIMTLLKRNGGRLVFTHDELKEVDDKKAGFSMENSGEKGVLILELINTEECDSKSPTV